MSVSLKFAIWAVVPPPIPGLKAHEKQLSQLFDSEEDALSALAKTKPIHGATLEVRPIEILSEEERNALAAAKVAEKEAAKAIAKANASFSRQITTIAKAIVLKGGSIAESDLFIALPDDAKTLVAAKVAELSQPENKAKLMKDSSPREKRRFKPLMLAGLARAVGKEKLSDIAPFPQRPDTHEGLLDYYAELSAFKRAVERLSPIVTTDHGENALYRKAYRSSLNRIQNELETVNYHAHQRREEVVTNRVVSHGKEFVERKAMLSLKSMPDWPLNEEKESKEEKVPSVDPNSEEETAKIQKLLNEMTPDMIENQARFQDEEKAKDRRKAINSVIRNEMGPGWYEHLNRKPVCKTKNYNHSGPAMKVHNYVAVFSKG